MDHLQRTLAYPDGRIYTGQVSLSVTGLFVPHGYGTDKRPNGETYTGSFFNGKKHGQGTRYDSTTQRTYRGGFVNDEEEGYATVTRPGAYGGRRDYVGYMCRGVRHGWGRQTQMNLAGEVTAWEGQWYMDVLTGMVSVTQSAYGTSNIKYEGVYINGRLEGAGWCTDYTTGLKRPVYFQNGNALQYY